jgi:tetratricopeptide (TPR) repeat protein
MSSRSAWRHRAYAHCLCAACLGAFLSFFATATAADPPGSEAVAAFNLCATLYNQGQTERALQACHQAVTLDPAKADAYFIIGSLQLGEAKMVDGKMIAPPGTVEALNKYLELAPNGAHANDVKQMLDFLK